MSIDLSKILEQYSNKHNIKNLRSPPSTFKSNQQQLGITGALSSKATIFQNLIPNNLTFKFLTFQVLIMVHFYNKRKIFLINHQGQIKKAILIVVF